MTGALRALRDVIVEEQAKQPSPPPFTPEGNSADEDEDTDRTDD
jgi:hypothetical protein